MIGHTEELMRSPKVKTLEALSSGTGGEVFNILFHEEIFSLVEHLIALYSRPKVQIKLENIAASGKTYLIDHSELISKHYNLIPANTIKNNTFLWQNGTETLKMSKFPLKCLDNFSLIHFPEEAYFINFDNILQTGNDLFHNVDYPSYPRYFVDVSHFFTPRRKLHVKGDVYQIENKELLDKFKIFVAHNPTLTKIKIPVYYYYQYELNYQLIGFLNFKTTSKDSAKMEFKHYPLKFLL